MDEGGRSLACQSVCRGIIVYEVGIMILQQGLE